MKKITILCFFALYTLVVLAQSEKGFIPIDNDSTPIRYKWLGSGSKIITKMGLIYLKPEGFKELGDVCFKEYPGLSELFTCLPNQLESEDKQLIAFIPIFRPITLQESIKLGSGCFGSILDTRHLNQMRAVLRSYYGKDVDWQSMLRYYPEDSAKSVFNADTAIRFTITLRPEDYYKKEYKYVEALFLQKNGRGYVNFYCFYTDKAKKNLDYYWKKIEGVLRYEE